MARPASRSRHGTAEHGTVSDASGNQVVTQRNAFSDGTTTADITGAFRGSVRSFNVVDRGTGEQIMQAAEAMMKYKSANGVGSTPSSGDSMDFPDGQSAGAMLFQAGNSKFNEVANATDNPNIFGPNTKVEKPLLDNPSSDVGSDKTTPATQNASADTTAQSNYNPKGYGISIDRNDPRLNPHGNRATLTHVLRDSPDTTTTTLGEYIDTATYNYTE
tara:strand:+ start:4363 stop:5013 length:651 start_codon:yes stop_codon:yes gene_type:complete